MSAGLTKLAAQGDIVERLRADANAHEIEGQRAEAADLIEHLRRVNIRLANENAELRYAAITRTGPGP